MIYLRHLTVAAVLASPLPALADTILAGNHSVTGKLCAGNACTANEWYTNDWLKLKAEDTSILFEDTSSALNVPSNDWRLRANDSSNGGSNYFAIVDDDAIGSPANTFVVEAGARANQLYLSNNQKVGIKTALPVHDLHIVSGYYPAIRLEQDTSQGGFPQTWDLLGNAASFGITHNSASLFHAAFTLRKAPSNSVFVDDNGNIGNVPGLTNPTLDASLDVWRNDGTAKIKVEEDNAASSPRTLMELSNNGRPEIVMANTGTNGEWSFGAGTNFVLKQGAVGTASSAKTKYLTLKAGSGDLEISGQIITGGPTCGAGCDAVFSPDYDLPSVEQHAAQMFALGHLPNVGATAPGAPLNLSEKLGDVLNELEHAHIYIARQNALIATMEARLSALENR